MTIPLQPIDVPPLVMRLAAGRDVEPVWLNNLGGVTFRAGDRYIKHQPRNAESTVEGEVRRLEWAGAFTTVPLVRDHGHDATHEWLVTEALPGRSAVDPRWVAEPETAVRAVGRGLRALHDALPVADCPFDWSVTERIANAGRRGIRVPDRLRNPPPVDRLVVCHADACCPNTLLDDDGEWTAHVDLGLLGTADRWADIAVAAMSTLWNYGPGWEGVLIEAYGVESDRERLAYYRALWDAT